MTTRRIKDILESTTSVSARHWKPHGGRKAWLSYLKRAETAFSSKLLLQKMKKWRMLNRELLKRTARSPKKGNMFSHFILEARKAAA